MSSNSHVISQRSCERQLAAVTEFDIVKDIEKVGNELLLTIIVAA